MHAAEHPHAPQQPPRSAYARAIPCHPLPSPAVPAACAAQFKGYKVVYRRYAGLFFCLGLDAPDSELAALEAVHLFVEVLDHYFSNVCELDLVFNFHKVGRAGWCCRAPGRGSARAAGQGRRGLVRASWA